MELADRMKQYEAVADSRLISRCPVILRVDGKAFHTFTRKMDRPFDMALMAAMWETAKALCAQVQGAMVAYTQSDEISVLLNNYRQINSEPWLANRIQRQASIAASIATAAFNEAMPCGGKALFDARAFNIPREEVVNYFIWRQKDWYRNAISMVARAHFSHKECLGKSCDELQEMLFQEKEVNWNDYPIYQKRGVCVLKVKDEKECTNLRTGQSLIAIRHVWTEDLEIPDFTKDRSYVERFVDTEEDGE